MRRDAGTGRFFLSGAGDGGGIDAGFRQRLRHGGCTPVGHVIAGRRRPVIDADQFDPYRTMRAPRRQRDRQARTRPE